MRNTLSAIGGIGVAMMMRAAEPVFRRQQRQPQRPALRRSERGVERDRLRYATAIRVELEQAVEAKLRESGVWRLEEGEAIAAFKKLPTITALMQSARALPRAA